MVGTLARDMTDTAKINAALEGFADWASPGKFIDAVVADLSLNAYAVDLLKQVWAEATHERHWTSADLESCRRIAEIAIRSKFSWLTKQASENVTRAASYLWR